MNVGLVVVAGASAWMVAGVAIASALGPRLRDSADAAGALQTGTIDRRASGPIRWLLPASIVGMAFASSTGLAAAGVLPRPVQGAAVAMFRSVGVDVPEAPKAVKAESAVVAAAAVTPPAPTSPATGSAAPTASAAPRAAGEGGGPAPAASSDDLLGQLLAEQDTVAPPPAATEPPAPEPVPAAPPALEPTVPLAPSERITPSGDGHSHASDRQVATSAPTGAAPHAPVTTVPADADSGGEEEEEGEDGEPVVPVDGDGPDPEPTTDGTPVPGDLPPGAPIVTFPSDPVVPDAPVSAPAGESDGVQDDVVGSTDDGAITTDDPESEQQGVGVAEPEPTVATDPTGTTAHDIVVVTTTVPPPSDPAGVSTVETPAVPTDPLGAALLTAGASVAASR